MKRDHLQVRSDCEMHLAGRRLDGCSCGVGNWEISVTGRLELPSATVGKTAGHNSSNRSRENFAYVGNENGVDV